MIEQIVQYLSSLDSNNFPNKCGVGEREARIACSKYWIRLSLVSRSRESNVRIESSIC